MYDRKYLNWWTQKYHSETPVEKKMDCYLLAQNKAEAIIEHQRNREWPVWASNYNIYQQHEIKIFITSDPSRNNTDVCLRHNDICGWQGINPSPKLVIKSPTCWSITALINSSPKCWWWLRNACITEMANNAAEIKQFYHRNIIFVTELIKLSPKGPNASPKFNPVSPVAFKSEIRYNLWYIVYFECIFKQSLR